jgi:hypothetical protein
MLNATGCFHDDFHGLSVLPATASAVGSPWGSVITGSTPTIKGVTAEATGAVQLLLTSTGEEQRAVLHFGDILSFALENLRRMIFRMRCSAITTAEIVVAGLASAYNATEDTVANNAWFRLAAATDILVESDDGSTAGDDDDNDTGLNITAAVYKEYLIDFSQGLSDVRFFVSDDNGRLARVLKTTTFSLAAATGYVQPYFSIHKASGATTPNLTLDYVHVDYVR